MAARMKHILFSTYVLHPRNNRSYELLEFLLRSPMKFLI